MPSSTEIARAELAKIQAATLASIIAGEASDGGWMAKNLNRPHPVILEQNIRPVHSENVSDAVRFFFPKFAANASVSDWGALSPFNPTTESLEWRLEHYAAIAFGAARHPGLKDLVRIEWAEFRQRNQPVLSTPDRVAAVRSLGALEFDSTGRMATPFGSFVRLETTWFDVHWISGHRPSDAVSFGPPRHVFFFTGADGASRSVVFRSLDELAVTLCFG